MTIRIIATGGTFDKQYHPIDGTLGFGESQVPFMLEQGRVQADFVFEALPLMDSLDMTDTDRETILKSCRMAPENQILIVHGTDTMHRTASVLAGARLNKTMVLTGAMIPYQVAGSDAFFNLGLALGAVQLLAPDVYIAMNGKIFRWDQVQKNRTLGIFETKR